MKKSGLVETPKNYLNQNHEHQKLLYGIIYGCNRKKSKKPIRKLKKKLVVV